jgi:hypothetical protein
MESLEHAARIICTAHTLGRVNQLTPDALARLAAERARERREPHA